VLLHRSISPFLQWTFSAIQWPFWILLFQLAVMGCFGRKVVPQCFGLLSNTHVYINSSPQLVQKYPRILVSRRLSVLRSKQFCESVSWIKLWERRKLVPNGGCCVYYPSNNIIFCNMCGFENWGISLLGNITSKDTCICLFQLVN